jgi:hypothetical protein
MPPWSSGSLALQAVRTFYSVFICDGSAANLMEPAFESRLAPASVDVAQGWLVAVQQHG